MTEIAPLPPLTPGQTQTLDRAQSHLGATTVLYLAGPTGSGKSTVLRHLMARTGGRLLTAADAMRALNAAPPAHLEEAIANLVRDALDGADILYVDDWWDMIAFGLKGSDRPFILQQWTTALFQDLAATGKTFVSTVRMGSDILCQGAIGAWIDLPAFDTDDKQAVLAHHLGRPIDREAVEAVEVIHRGLNGYQLQSLASVARERIDGPVTGTDLIALLDLTTRPTNVVLDEVEDVSNRALIGSEAAIDTLERTVVVPITQPDLARQFGLRPARGVLLHGPPGTGKTTLGRLLAHRMEGKFFILDGTLSASHPEFPARVNRLLDQAAACSPSIVFIDDADVIFGNGQARGFVRQLLTKLDGLASDSQRDVCLVMTAMDVADLPPALIRSGRVDVWIELKAPDLASRAAILRNYIEAAPEPPGDYDALGAAEACEGFTPADLRSMVSDARSASAYATLTEEPAVPFDAYLASAAADIAARKRLIGV